MDSNQNAYKGMVFVFIFFSILLFPHYTQAGYQTTLSFSGYIQDQAVSGGVGGDLDANIWSAPTVYDWDSDGAKDLLVGRKAGSTTGYVSFYKNYGSDNSPSFNGYTDIQACNNTCLLNVTADG